MIFLRKLLVWLLSVVLLISLLGVALATSTDLNLNNSHKLSAWLEQSDLYGSLINRGVSQSQHLIGGASNNQATGTLKQTIEAAFPRSQLDQDINTFLNSNFAWLKGQSPSPSFRIDLSNAKQQFATNLGSYVYTRLNNLPACSYSQTLQLQGANPFTLSCLPTFIDPASIRTQITSEARNSDVFLGNPVVTASSLNSTNTNQGKPYYQQIASAPKIYKWAVKAPWLFSALAVICALLIVFLAPLRRRGSRRLGWVLILSSTLLIAGRLLYNSLLNTVNKHINSSAGLDFLKPTVTNFVHLAGSSIMKINMYFAATYLVLGLIIFVWLIISHRQGRQVAAEPINQSPPMQTKENPSSPTTEASSDQPQATNQEPTTTPPLKDKPGL